MTDTPRPVQDYQIEAWLGDDHGLDDERLARLRDEADRIAATWPDPDNEDERTAALTAAYRVLLGEDDLVETLAAERTRARRAEIEALAALRQVAVMTVRVGVRGRHNPDSPGAFARRAGVERSTVLGWLEAN
ncbi:hypothetical protein GCM10022243_48800 [Saccharothrix violaceirubra]|uniref:Uncharacterized protein n=1 Tax=Saccharothrix violaceirubra TaxID=413306 RepID=A0A7W7SZJ1_9PSEU|nr:hypothetical protein [Saccharothrix violaceirubra]MBB4963779.1 hypothetical protein [Saccharothrix violaceirubra]